MIFGNSEAVHKKPIMNITIVQLQRTYFLKNCEAYASNFFKMLKTCLAGSNYSVLLVAKRINKNEYISVEKNFVKRNKD